MNSQLFFILNLFVAGAFLIWFLSSRKDTGKPTRLSLKKGEGPGKPLPPPASKTPARAPENAPVEAPPPTEIRPRAKNLNVLFLYNGHDWDAYEVLGVPAGASITLVTARYQELVRNADKGKHEFLEAAYQAILKKV